MTDKDLLPVTRLNFGRIFPGSNGKHTLGKFQCSGRKTLSSMPTNCRDLFIAGNQINGFYAIKSSSTQISTVYCDFSKDSNAAGYETIIGFNDLKTSPGVYFYVQRNTTYSINETVIPYQLELLNVGNAINLTSGIFTIPIDGRYHLTFNALSNAANSLVQLRLNGLTIASSFATEKLDEMPISATLPLKRGDQVCIFMYIGPIYDDNNHYTQFNGFLIEQDLILL